MQSAVVSEVLTGEPFVALPTPLRHGMRRPRVRFDSLPENTRYRDDGCDISESCFTCPLPKCRYEEPGGLRAILNEQRDWQIIQLRMKGVPVDALADHFGISRRTVFRVIGSAKTTGRAARNDDLTPIPIRPELSIQKENAQREAHCA
jgi:hypothetical protein